MNPKPPQQPHSVPEMSSEIRSPNPAAGKGGRLCKRSQPSVLPAGTTPSGFDGFPEGIMLAGFHPNDDAGAGRRGNFPKPLNPTPADVRLVENQKLDMLNPMPEGEGE